MVFTQIRQRRFHRGYIAIALATVTCLTVTACNSHGGNPTAGGSPSTSPSSAPSVPPTSAPAGPAASSTPTPTTDASTPPADTPVTYSGPLTISKGGTYQGNWASDEPNTPAVTVNTSDPVTIQSCHLRGKGSLIHFGNGQRLNLTVRNCVGLGLDSGITGKAQGFFLFAYNPLSITVENNTIQHTRGIELIGDNTRKNVDKISIQRNRVRDIDARLPGGVQKCDGATNEVPFGEHGTCGGNFAQLNGFVAAPDIEIAFNEVINTPGNSSTEDVINLYHDSGTADHPLRVHDNYLQGAYPANPATDGSSGSGIDLADGDDTNPDIVTAWVRGYNNQVVNFANVGMFIAAGHDNEMYNNRVVSSGKLPNGQSIKAHFAGIYVWDCCYHFVQNGHFNNNVAHDNVLGYAYVDDSGKVQRNDSDLRDCAKAADGTSLCRNNTAIPGDITAVTEKGELTRWADKLRNQKVTLGAAA